MFSPWGILRFALFVFFLGLWTWSLLKDDPVPSVISEAIPGEWKFWMAKGLHVSAYLFLTLLAAWLPVPRWIYLGIVGVLLFHGVGTEVGQTFTDSRGGSIRDVMLDWIGVGLGNLILFGLEYLKPKVYRYEGGEFYY